MNQKLHRSLRESQFHEHMFPTRVIAHFMDHDKIKHNQIM